MLTYSFRTLPNYFGYKEFHMLYSELYVTLQNLFNQEEDEIHIPTNSVKILNRSFHSNSYDVLPGSSSYRCHRHDKMFEDEYSPSASEMGYSESLDTPDCDFTINKEFRYSVFLPETTDEISGVILLFHGLNERHWDKYLPWAYRLVEETGKAVILFPLAFHMNRAPGEWGHPKRMRSVSAQRKERYPSIAQSSFANAAISARIQMAPQRFFWSGRQTYSDILQLIYEIRRGKIPFLSKSSSIDFFSYSIGSFLSEILIMTNPKELFSDSKLFIFCGGPTLDRMYPVSKYILDSEANIALYSFFIEHLDNECRLNERLDHYFNRDHRSGTYFKAMLSLHRNREIREKRLKEIGTRIKAVALRNDEVIPPGEVLNTLKGDFRDLPAEVEVVDFPFDYTHITPFPLKSSIKSEVNEAFNTIFDMAALHFK